MTSKAATETRAWIDQPDDDLKRKWQLHLAALVALQALQFYVNLPVWRDIFAIGIKDEEMSQILLAPIVCFYLVFQRKEQFTNWAFHGRWIGIPILLIAWLFQIIGDLYGYESVWHSSAVLSMIGCIVGVLGSEVIKRFWPALIVLGFMVPVPGILRRAIAFPLQELTATMAASISVAVGMNVEQAGSLLYINNQAVAIAEACSGLRMVFALGLITWALAFGSRLAWWERAVILALSPVLAVLANLIRVLPTLWGYGYLDQNVADMIHDWGGWVMLAFAFVIPRVLISVIEKPVAHEVPQMPRAGFFERHGMPAWLTPVGIAVLLVSIGLYMPAFEIPQNRDAYFAQIKKLAVDLPLQIGTWEGRSEPPQEAAQRLLRPNVIMQRQYRNTITNQYLSLLFVHCGDLRDMEGHYPRLCYPNQGWELQNIERMPIETAKLDFEVRLYRFKPGRWQDSELFVYSYFIVPDHDPIVPDYAPIRRAATNPQRRMHGGAQVQLVFDNTTTREEQLRAVHLFTATMTDLLNTIAEGAESPNLKLEPMDQAMIEVAGVQGEAGG